MLRPKGSDKYAQSLHVGDRYNAPVVVVEVLAIDGFVEGLSQGGHVVAKYNYDPLYLDDDLYINLSLLMRTMPMRLQLIEPCLIVKDLSFRDIMDHILWESLLRKGNAMFNLS